MKKLINILLLITPLLASAGNTTTSIMVYNNTLTDITITPAKPSGCVVDTTRLLYLKANRTGVLDVIWGANCDINAIGNTSIGFTFKIDSPTVGNTFTVLYYGYLSNYGCSTGSGIECYTYASNGNGSPYPYTSLYAVFKSTVYNLTFGYDKIIIDSNKLPGLVK
jgi:hypothetical protein